MAIKLYDCVIIGAGPGGLTAAIYTRRKGMKTLIVSIDIGGQTNLAPLIENYPGIDAISGIQLMQKFLFQAKKFGVDIRIEKVKKIEKNKGNFKITLSNREEINTKSIIITSGKIPEKLGIPGEDKFLGKGVSMCITCDGPLYRNKTAVIVGGGNSAAGSAIWLSKIAKKIYLIHRRKEFRADKITLETIKKIKNIEIIKNSIPIEILGDKNNKIVEKIKIKNIKTKKIKEIKTDSVFIEIGCKIDDGFFKDIVKTDDKKRIIIDINGKTSQEGIFAAGDITNSDHKQIVIAAGEGAKAALGAYEYVSKKGK